jgi:hypothetical protein
MSAVDDRDDYVLQETLDGKSARAIGKQLKCTVGEVHTVLDRVLPTIDNEARMRHIALDLSRLDQLLAVFLKRAIDDKDQPSGMLCVKILERKSALLGLDQPTKLDVVQVHVKKQPDSFEKIRAAIWHVARGDQPMPEHWDGSDNSDNSKSPSGSDGNGSKDDLQ